MMIFILCISFLLIAANMALGYPRFGKLQRKLDRLNEVSREFLDRFVPRIFSIDGQKFIWELNLFQESCTVQCNVRGTYNYHSISAEKIMPGKTKAKKVDGAVNRILEDTNSTRFWVHTYDDDPISRLL